MGAVALARLYVAKGTTFTLVPLSASLQGHGLLSVVIFTLQVLAAVTLLENPNGSGLVRDSVDGNNFVQACLLNIALSASIHCTNAGLLQIKQKFARSTV